MPWSMKKRRPIFARGMYLDSRSQKSGYLRHKTRQKRNISLVPQARCAIAMHQYGVEARIAEDDFQLAFRRRVLAKMVSNCSAYNGEH